MNNFSITNCEITGSSTVCSTELPQFYVNGFSYGEIMTIFLMILILIILFFKTLKEWIFNKDTI